MPLVYSGSGPVSIAEIVGAGVLGVASVVALVFLAVITLLILFRLTRFAITGRFHD